jgi:hypothetical protein
MSRLLHLFFSLVLLAAVVHSAAAQTLTPLHTFRHRDVSSVVFSPDGKTLATGGGDWATPDCVRLWDVPTGKLRHTLRDSRDDWNIASIAFPLTGAPSLTLAMTKCVCGASRRAALPVFSRETSWARLRFPRTTACWSAAAA